MMKTIFGAFGALLIGLSLLWTHPVDAWLVQVPASAPAYSGPGDIVSGAIAWYGVRAYNAAYATGTNNAFTLRRASDNTTQNIVILSNGNVDVASAHTFGGVDVTCTSGSTAGSSTTITLSGCSGSPVNGDQLVAAGVTSPPTITTACSISGGAGTCTLKYAVNIPSPIAVSFDVALFVTTAFDQSGNARNATQATTAAQPQFMRNCINTIPCLWNYTGQYLSATIPSTATPFSLSLYAQEAAGGYGISTFAGGFSGILEPGFSTNTLRLYCGGDTTIAEPIGSWHAENGTCTGTSGVVNVDNGTNTTGAGTTAATSTGLGLLAQSNGATQMVGGITEAGAWPSNFVTSIPSLSSNQISYY